MVHKPTRVPNMVVSARLMQMSFRSASLGRAFPVARHLGFDFGSAFLYILGAEGTPLGPFSLKIISPPFADGHFT
jgi:hypothetical protein